MKYLKILMSSNPHNLTLTSSYSRIYDEIAKLSKLNVESAAAIKPDNNISVKTNYTTLTPYLTREDLGFDKIPVQFEIKASRQKWEDRFEK